VSELNHTKLRNAVSEFKNALLLHLVTDINHMRLPDLASDINHTRLIWCQNLMAIRYRRQNVSRTGRKRLRQYTCSVHR